MQTMQTMQTMLSHALASHLLLLLLLCVQIIITEAQSDAVLDHLCYPEYGNYTKGSPFQFNLNTLLTSLASQTHLNDFYTTTSGNGTDKAYGLMYCRGDVSEEDCRTCQKKSAKKIVELCPNSKRAHYFNDSCWISYCADVYNSTQPVGYYDEGSATRKTESFIMEVRDLINQLTSRASFAISRLASGKSNQIYGLVQCARQSSLNDCVGCVQERVRYINGLPSAGMERYRALDPTCFVRYERYSFFQSSSPPPATVNSQPPPRSPGNKTMIAIVTAVVVTLLLISSICIFLYWRKRGGRVSRRLAHQKPRTDEEEDLKKHIDSLIFDLRSIREATEDFSDSYKLGEGGFGPVYKGCLADGREIAVKRLSRLSSQGLDELKTEVVSLANLRHRNLVRLMGFCLQEEQKILVYEYLSNGSLDRFVFDQNKRLLLGWDNRYKIIIGIARGLHYLHDDSQLRIIHRDLKASNILLDENMNAKISDFGFAKLFDENQFEANTNRIAGTFGYMAPEYVTNGSFSTKSDIFSFGVLLLEIVAGRKNASLHHSENLLSSAWRNWNEGTPLEIVDATLCVEQIEALKCIELGLLCVEEDASIRPTMSQILQWLNTQGVTFPVPSRPAFAFFTRKITESDESKNSSIFKESDQSTMRESQQSINDLTISHMESR